jgi:hypothetical protein
MAISQAVDLSALRRDRTGARAECFPEVFVGNVADPDRLEPKA